jgi:dTDP-4-amino-4,6-dideoxygalactose transaminase
LAKQDIIPFFGLKRQYANLREELLQVSDTVYKSGQVLDGPFTESFERRMALRCDRRYAVAVNSCTQALIFAQQLLFKEPAKILIPTISFVATINSVLLNGNTPLLCDTDDRALIDLESIDYALNAGNVNGIMYVNLFGNVVDWDRFSLQTKFFGQDIPVIEDAAQSFGASYKGIPSGKLGDISVLSFDPTKNLPNYGSGGMVLVDNLYDAKILRDLRDNGKTNDHDYPGTNSKMSEVDCAQMILKLEHFDAWQQRRTEIAEYYNEELADCRLIDIPTHSTDVVHAWHKYVIRTSDRSKLKHHLAMRGIETKIHYEKPLFEYPVGYPYINYVSELYRNASAFCTECLSLPIYPELTDSEVEHIVESVKEFIG